MRGRYRFSGMYGFLFRPLWLLFHAVVAAAIVAMVFLGFWQLDRLDQRREFNAQVIERSEQSPIPLEKVLADIDSGALSPNEAEWLPVVATGSYLPEQIVEFNQSQADRAGENVLSALLLDDSTTVIVNRGFIVLGTTVPDAPTTEVTVIGLVRTSEVRNRGGLTDADDGPVVEVRRIDIPRIAPQLPGEVASVYVQLVRSEPPIAASDPVPITRPELDSGPHLSYAVQWFVFATCVAIGWVLAVRRSIRNHRRDADATQADPDVTDEADEQTPVGSR